MKRLAAIARTAVEFVLVWTAIGGFFALPYALALRMGVAA